MTPIELLDSGPLVAYLASDDSAHAWALEQFARHRPPFLTCEAVLSESFFLLQRYYGGSLALTGLLERGIVRAPFRFEDERAPVCALINRYANVPMSLADACLVRMAEQYPGAVLLTLDGDFTIYRKSNRQPLDVLMPAALGG